MDLVHDYNGVAVYDQSREGVGEGVGGGGGGGGGGRWSYIIQFVLKMKLYYTSYINV